MPIELTADQLGSVSSKLRAIGARREPAERRRTPRLDVRATVSVAMVEDGDSGPAITMRIRDLSPCGVSLLHPQAMPFGQQFVLTLQRADGPPVQILCTVMNCRSGRTKLFTIGAEFTCALSPLPMPVTPTEAELERIKRSMLD
jgi:hypothetical protein